ncbi:MAG: site-specific integrase [Bacteroidales bacterium]|nr:site-specific integrase [Bacteroidales bacterium]
MKVSIKYFIKSKTNNIASVRVRVRRRNKESNFDITAVTGLQTKPKFWNNDKGVLRDLSELSSIKEDFNKKLNDIEAAIKTECNRITAPDVLTADQLKTIIDKVNNPDKYKEPELKKVTLFEFIQHFIDTASTRINTDTNAPISKRTIQEYKYSFNYLKRYSDTKPQELSFSDIDYEFYKDYIDYLRIVGNLNNNTIGKRIKTLKTFLNAATDEGVNTYTKYKSKRFKVFKEESDNIYLTKDELQAFYSTDFSKTPHLERVRDLFIVACYTGLRYSDLSKVKSDNIKDNILTVTQQKTSNKIYIPVHLTVWQILRKYDNQLPKVISNQKFNEYLKAAAKQSKALNSEFIKATTKKGLRHEKTFKKHELISSHTARRTFCTNSYLDGIPAITIMAISGHKTESAFLKYIKVNKEEHAKKMLKVWQENGEYLQMRAN